MRVLGLAAFHRDAAAALVVDGRPVAAVQEERFTRKPRDPSFPRRAARWCLESAGLRASELDLVAFYEKPLRKFERTLLSQLRAFPRSSRTFARDMFSWLGDRMWTRNRIEDELEIPRERIVFVEHAHAHAAASFWSSPFDDAAILILDDVGEWTNTWMGTGDGTRLTGLVELPFPHSLGLVASALTQFLGFEPGADEPLVEALAALGEPRLANELRELVPSDTNGGIRVDPRAFRFAYDHERLFGPLLEERLGPARRPGSPLRASGTDRRDSDLAASWQLVMEERVLDLLRDLFARAPREALCVGGMLAANRALLSRIAAEGPFARLYVPPDSDEAGAALGAALIGSSLAGDDPRIARGSAWRLGEDIGAGGVEGAVELGARERILQELEQRLLGRQCVGWARGRLEFGARSLGCRIVLGDTRGDGAREALLSSIQPGESWRPCRLAVPLDQASRWFELPAGAMWPAQHAHIFARASADLARHAPSAVDGAGRAWPQLVDGARDPDLLELLRRVGDQSGAPALFVSDLCLRGQPLARNEAESVEVFRRSKLDALVCSSRLYTRS